MAHHNPGNQQVLTLPDGVRWGFGRCGCSGGRPVLVHHGLIGDAAFGPEWDALGQSFGLEWIMLERPGYGQTAPMRMQQLAEWPDMIAPVLDALGITD